MEHYFHGVYNREDVSTKLKELGFSEEIKNIQGIEDIIYISNYKDFIIHLTSPRKGKLQIQGDGPKDIELNGSLSKFYEFYKTIIKSLEPEKITNSKSEIFYSK